MDPAIGLGELENGDRYLFADWPIAAVPRVAVGTYTIWDNDRFLYVGVAGRGLDAAEVQRRRDRNAKPCGLFDRLNSHASGRRSGDQFCIYVCDRLILPLLSAKELQSVGVGEISLDVRTRDFIRNSLDYRFSELDSYPVALEIERSIQRGALAVGPPTLNPLAVA